jgi:hypothetical protein
MIVASLKYHIDRVTPYRRKQRFNFLLFTKHRMFLKIIIILREQHEDFRLAGVHFRCWNTSSCWDEVTIVSFIKAFGKKTCYYVTKHFWVLMQLFVLIDCLLRGTVS